MTWLLLGQHNVITHASVYKNKNEVAFRETQIVVCRIKPWSSQSDENHFRNIVMSNK